MKTTFGQSFNILYRHFLEGYFCIQASDGGREADLSIGPLLALLSAPGILASLFGLFKTGPLLTRPPADFVISTLDDELMFIVVAMVTAGLVSVLNFGKLFIDDADFSVLGPLPLHMSAVVCARLAAFFTFVFLLCAAVNAASVLLYPLTAVPTDASLHVLARFYSAHFVTVMFCSIFMAALMVSICGLIRLLIFRLLETAQLFLTAALVSFLFLGMTSLRQFVLAPEFGNKNPSIWFLGLYQELLPVQVPNIVLRGSQVRFDFPGWSAAGIYATLEIVPVAMLLLSAAIAADLIYRARVPRSRSRISSLLLLACPAGTARATAQMYILGLLRVRRCRMTLTIFCGAGAGLVLNELVTNASPTATLFAIPFMLVFVITTGMAAVARMQIHMESRWLFQTSALSSAAPVKSGIRWTIGCACTLFLTAVFPIYAALLGPLHAASSLVFCGMSAALLIQALTWNMDFIPFTFQKSPGSQHLPLLFVGYVLSLTAYSSLFGAAAKWLNNRWVAQAATIAILMIVIIVVRRAAKHRDKTRQVQFMEPELVEVLVLNLQHDQKAKYLSKSH